LTCIFVDHGLLRKGESGEVDRIFREKAVPLAEEIWKDKGSPEGGYMQFVDEACERIKTQMQEE
jgi:hypothetical protein